MLYGVIDTGSNTIRLMIYRVENGTLHPVLNNKYSAGLANYITGSGDMSKEGIQKVVYILKEMKNITKQIALDGLFPFGTASLRNIGNTKEVLSAIKKETGLTVRVLSGEEEALFDYYGAMQSIPMESGLLVDVGGGSTELVYFKNRKAEIVASMPTGSLNLYSRFVERILPTKAEIEEIEEEVIRHLRKTPFSDRKPGVKLICAVGGTARAALKLYNSIYNKTENHRFEANFYQTYLSKISAAPGDVADKVLRFAPERIHTLTPGIVIMHTVANAFQIGKVVTSPYGVREGFLYSLLKKRGILHGADQSK